VLNLTRKMTGLNNSQTDDMNSDFDLFDSIMENVEAQRREEEEFFDVKTPTKAKENKDMVYLESQSPNLMEVDTHESVRIDGSRGASSLKLPDSRCTSSSISLEKFEGSTAHAYTPDVHDSFDGIEIKDSTGKDENDDAEDEKEEDSTLIGTFEGYSIKCNEEKADTKSVIEVPSRGSSVNDLIINDKNEDFSLDSNSRKRTADADDQTKISKNSDNDHAPQNDTNCEVVTNKQPSSPESKDIASRDDKQSPESKDTVNRDDNSSSTTSNFDTFRAEEQQSDSESEQIEFFEDNKKDEMSVAVGNNKRTDEQEADEDEHPSVKNEPENVYSEKENPEENVDFTVKNDTPVAPLSVDESAENIEMNEHDQEQKLQTNGEVYKENPSKTGDDEEVLNRQTETNNHHYGETESLKQNENNDVEKTTNTDVVDVLSEIVSLTANNTSETRIEEDERCDSEVNSQHKDVLNQNRQHRESKAEDEYETHTENEEEQKKDEESDEEVGESREKADFLEETMRNHEEEPKEESRALQQGHSDHKNESQQDDDDDGDESNNEESENLNNNNNDDDEFEEEPNKSIPRDDNDDEEELENTQEPTEDDNENNNDDDKFKEEPHKSIPRDETDDEEELKNTQEPTEDDCNNKKEPKSQEDLDNIDKEDEEAEKEITKSKKKKVIFLREGDTYDELGDRRYDVRTLEMLSESESEYVNIREVQQAQVELSEYTRNLQNYNSVISELEKTPADRRQEEEATTKTISFNLGELLMDGIMGDENANSSTSERVKSAKKNTKKLKKKKKKKDASCKQCKQTPANATELNGNGICKTCYLFDPMKLTNKNKRRMKSAKKDEEIAAADAEDEDRINKEVKAALDSRLESTENTALKNWLESKNKEERKKKRQERREKKAKAKENKQKRLQEAKKQQRAKEKVEEWEAKKRKESKEKRKMNNISASLKTDKSRPILNSYGAKSISPATESPRSNATFEVTEKNSFERFREGYLGSGDSDSKPPTFSSVEAFIQSVIDKAVLELEKETNIVKSKQQVRLERPKSHAVKLQTNKSDSTKSTAYRPTPPKSANPRRGLQRGIRKTIPISREATAMGLGVQQSRLMRSRTYEEWLSDKKVRKDFRSKEKEINRRYDMLQQKLIELEKERRHALVEVRAAMTKDYNQQQQSTTNLPKLTKRLEPQGSESLRSQHVEAKKH